MSTQLQGVRLPDLPPPHDLASLPAREATLSTLDRATLHLGLWLLLRAARSTRVDHSEHARRVANERSRTVRDHDTLRLHQLWPRP